MGERRWEIWECPVCREWFATIPTTRRETPRHDDYCTGRHERVAVVPAPEPGTRVYQLTDEQAKVAADWIRGHRPGDIHDSIRVGRLLDDVVAVLRAGLDDSEKEGT